MEDRMPGIDPAQGAVLAWCRDPRADDCVSGTL